MKTWENIRDEVAGMLVDGKPLEDIISRLEQYKNEMAKAELIKVFDELKNPQLTNDEWRKHCSAEEFAKFLKSVKKYCDYVNDCKQCPTGCENGGWLGWLREVHKE